MAAGPLEDTRWMRRALRLAARGFTPPNPMVGCVLVRDGEIVGEGFHLRAGGPHAEAMALRAAGERARGSTVYVSLEPCVHFGRTPPCTQALIAAGVRRVVVAAEDPNPVVAGRGLSELAAAGIEVRAGVLEPEARELNEAFYHFHATGRPFVALKAAMTLDGKIATRSGDSRWITGPAARRHAHRLRARSGAVLCGIGTVLADDPLLTARIPRIPRQPLRVVLDTDLRLPADSRLVRSAAEFPVLVAAAEHADAGKAGILSKLGVEILRFATDKEGQIPLNALLSALGERQVISILVEGGGAVHASFLRMRLAQRLYWFIAPMIVGGREAPTAVEGNGVDLIAQAIKLERRRSRWIGSDLLIDGLLDYPEMENACGAS